MADERLTKNQRREEARLAAQRLKEEQARTARRQRNMWIGAGAALLVVVVVVASMIIAAGNQPAMADVELSPEGSTMSGGIPVGPEGIAGVTDGADDDAVTVAIYSDFICPYCQMFDQLNAATLAELREAGEIIVEYHPVSILDRASAGSRYSTRAATATVLTAAEAPESFVAFTDALFAAQPQEGTVGLSDAEIADIARDAGVPEEVAAKIASGEYLGDSEDDPATYQPWVKAATDQGSKDLGGLGTPTILLNGVKLDTLKYDWTQEGVLAQAIQDARG